MFSASILLAISLALFQGIESVLFQEEKIEAVDLNYLCIHTEVPGKPTDKNPVLLIHGITSSLNDWDGFQQALALITNRRVCSVDMRNHGGSPWNNRMDSDAITADVMKFLDKKEIKKVNIIGHSLGGKTAVNIAVKYPERVESIVVEDMRPNGVTKKADEMIGMFMMFSRLVIKLVPPKSDYNEAQNFLMRIIEPQLKVLKETINKNQIALRRDDEGKWQWKSNLDLLNKIGLAKMLKPTEGVYEGPALFIHGGISPADVGSDRDNIMKMFPNAKLIKVEGASHTIHGNFKQFKDEVLKFLDDKN